jgi:hypothetical protein
VSKAAAELVDVARILDFLRNHPKCGKARIARELQIPRDLVAFYIEAHTELAERFRPNPGRPSKTTAADVREVIEDHPMFTLSDICRELGCSRSTVNYIMSLNPELRELYGSKSYKGLEQSRPELHRKIVECLRQDRHSSISQIARWFQVSKVTVAKIAEKHGVSRRCTRPYKRTGHQPLMVQTMWKELRANGSLSLTAIAKNHNWPLRKLYHMMYLTPDLHEFYKSLKPLRAHRNYTHYALRERVEASA